MKMKKFAALAAATVMSVSAIAATSAFGVFATTDAGVNNIVIKDSDTNRVYKAYQIFDQASATNTIKWGKGINGDALLTSLKTSGLSTYMSQFDSAESAVDVAKIISDADHWTKEDTAKFAKAASACIIDNKSVTAYEDNPQSCYRPEHTDHRSLSYQCNSHFLSHCICSKLCMTMCLSADRSRLSLQTNSNTYCP